MKSISTKIVSADIKAVAESHGLKKVAHLSKNQWASVVFKS